ncbi:hypothetical protein M422DRAFT_264857 [Sphaerobolus stellatus SS14]|uniref:Uncharacterized protein n=1 Tax=Sphaerobolus stellatus (strain SS14) TaxID=990650 RepID=A0A0C9V7G6_SPHS4|nr:hypothetical protein M422DRAFT_264857 [Sphaerobolus stellatus SS14]
MRYDLCAYTLHQTTTASNQTSHSPATGVDECAEVPGGEVPGRNLGGSPDTSTVETPFQNGSECLPDNIHDKPKFYPFFKQTLGEIDGSYILVSPPATILSFIL